MDRLEIREVDLAALSRLLRRVDFFAPLTIAQLEKVLPYIYLYFYQPGEKVFEQGGAGDAFYVIYEGEVAIQIKQGLFGMGFAKKVAALKPGDFFGEMALLAREKRGASAVAQSALKLFVLTEADFSFILKGNPGFAEEIKKIAKRRKFLSSH